MEFGNQIKKLRLDNSLTQDELAQRMNVSRQAVSNWENNKNFPDLEMIIDISRVFSLSLDDLLLGGNKMNDITQKLIKDGSETRRARFNMISLIIGGTLLCLGAGLIVLKGMTVEYVDSQGILHENFFLLPIGFLLMFCGVIAFMVTGIRSIVYRIKNNRRG